MDNQDDLITLFNDYFTVVMADSADIAEECYRLRYRVYCEEALIPGFDAKNYPERLERDYYDHRAVQCLLLHKPTGRTAGTVRIILPDAHDADLQFPLEKATGICILPHQRIGEISRLILAPEFRSRRGERRQPQGAVEDEENTVINDRRKTTEALDSIDLRAKVPRRRFPHAIFGLFVGIMRMSTQHELHYWYGGMEPVCARFLRSFGIDFAVISPLLDYFGPCKGYFCYIPGVLENIKRVNEPMWHLLTDNGSLVG